MKRAWIPGTVAVLALAAVGVGIAQASTEDARQQVFQAWADIIGIRLPPSLNLDSAQTAPMSSETTDENEQTEQTDSLTSCPTASSADHPDLAVPNYLQFVEDDGNICASSDLHISSQGGTEISAGPHLALDSDVVALRPASFYGCIVGDEWFNGWHLVAEGDYGMTDFTLAENIGIFGTLGGLLMGDIDPVKGVYLGSNGADDLMPDGILRLTSGYIDEQENVVEPVAELRVENDDQEITAHVMLTNDGDSGAAQIGNEKSSLTIDANGNVVVQLGE